MAAPAIPGFGELIEIGRGGFSRVYRAREFEFDRFVAVKVLNDPIKDGSTAAVFERECRTMGRLLHHPNIVTVIRSAFTDDDRPCIVMELFHEGSYHQLLRQSGPVGLKDLLAMGVKIAGALLTAHEAKVLHGDVKPGNIFRSRFAEPALGDFGIASFVRGNAERATRGFSVHYAAPDLIDGTPTTSSDQYSLAASLFTLALGRRPFESSESAAGDTNEQIMLRVLRDPVPRLPDRFPDAFTDALWRAMSKDPDNRWVSLIEFADRLNAAEAELGLATTRLPLDTGIISPDRRSAETQQHPNLRRSADPRVSAGPVEPGDRQAPSVDAERGAAAHLTRAGPDAGPDESAGLSREDSFDAYASGLNVAGIVVLSGGRTEPVDADLIIGRHPATQPLKAHQRAVIHGHDDRTVSRRQFELRVQGSLVTAVNVGSSTAAVMAADGTMLDLATGGSRRLEGGDTLFYGADRWLRFESAGASREAPSRSSAVAGASPQRRRGGEAAEGSAVTDGAAADGATQDRLPDRPPNPSEAPDSGSVLGRPARAAGIMFSDDRVERLDADLIVGRSPRSEPLESHQRAVLQGEGDRTVSRRHVELRSREGQVIAAVVGRGAVVQRADGTVHEQQQGAECVLDPGDILHYGSACWLRYADAADA